MTDTYPAPAQTGPEPEPFVEPWAHWGRRVGATLLDAGLQLPFVVLTVIITTIATDPHSGLAVRLIADLIGLAVSIASLVFAIWNGIVRQGRHGASVGKQCFGILVLSMNDARPIGGLATFGRNLLHVLDSLSFGLGYLWPLWDKKRQTFADKAMNTAVLYLPGVRF
ncbi:MAG: putative rane protein [Marmoricola sp.]|nr:putative rane protein [Marmoricola sp.]